MKNKYINLLLIFVFGLCGLFGVCGLPNFQAQASSAQADVWNGEYTDAENNLDADDWWHEGNSYYIRSAKGLSFFASQLNSRVANYNGATIYLEKDIDLAGYEWKAMGGVFNGTFDAKGHYIYNLNIVENGDCAGFFGEVGVNAKVKNLNLRDVDISSTSATYVGGIVGQISSGTAEISNCSVEGEFAEMGASSYVGGIVGHVVGGKVYNSMADVSVTAESVKSVGGLVGSAQNSEIKYSYAKGKLDVLSGNIGGLVGETENCTLENVYSLGEIGRNETSAPIGGLVGFASGNLQINKAYSAKTINYSLQMGCYAAGLVGLNTAQTASISNSFMVGKMQNSSGEEGKHSSIYNHDANAASLTKVFFDDTLPYGQEENEFAVEDLTLLAKTADFYSNSRYFGEFWDFESENGWKIVSSDFPIFNFTAGEYKGENGSLGNNDDNLSALQGDGTENSPYLIQTAGDLAYVSDIYSQGVDGIKYFSLQNDIDLTGKTWTPIGATETNFFTGVFDGNGHAIYGLTCSLQDKFEYHALFGHTLDAVIKNLTMGSVEFLNDANSNKTKASLVGNVIGNTYIVNCVDMSDESSVANVERGLFVAYGKSNILSDVIDESTLNINGLSYTKLYDVTISSQGGNVYSKDVVKDGTLQTNRSKTALSMEYAYKGENHVLLDTNGAAVSQDIDQTFDKNIPTLSESVGKKDVIIRRGFKLQGFSYDGVRISYNSSSENWSNNFDSLSAVKGIKAVWDEATQIVKVVYNEYEKTNFETSVNNTYIGKPLLDQNGQKIVGADGKDVALKAQNGQVFAEFVVEYDSFVWDFDYLFITPQYQTEDENGQKLRGEDFAVEGLYENFEGEDDGAEFSNQVLSKEKQDAPKVKTILNSDVCYYTRWQGTQNQNTITFDVVGDGEFDLKQALVGDACHFNLLGFENESSEKSLTKTAQAQSQNPNSYTISFTYDSKFSDRKDNYLQFDFALNQGFTLNFEGQVGSGDVLLSNMIKAPSMDSNFGKLKFNIGANALSTIGDFNSVKFYNLYGNVTITFKITREIYVDNLTITDGVYFGIGAREVVSVTKGSENNFTSNVTIQQRGSWDDILNLVDDDATKENLAAQENLYFAIDVIHGKLMFSTDRYDSVDIDLEQYAQDNQIQIRYEFSFTQYAIYTLGFTEAKDEITLEKDNIFQVRVNFAEDNPESAEFRYKATNNFVFVFSTEAENTTEDVSSFNTYGYQNAPSGDGFVWPQASNTKLSTNVMQANSVTKFTMEYEDFVRPAKDLNGELLYGNLAAIVRYTKATFKFNLKYAGENELLPQENAMAGHEPKILSVLDDGNYSVDEDGTIELYVENSDYFRFFADRKGQNEIVLYSNGDQGGYDSTQSIFNIQAVALKVEGGEDADYIASFNSANGIYLKNATIERFAKGTLIADFENTFVHDVYKISIKYSSQNNLDRTGLRAGLYDVTLVCTDVFYNIEYQTNFVDFADVYDQNTGLPSQAKLLGEGAKLTDEEASLVETAINATSSSAKMEENKISNVKFSDSIQFFTQLGTNKGYSFFRWIVESEGQKRAYSSANFERAFGSIFQAAQTIDDNLANKVSIKAVYIKKQMTLALSGGVLLETETSTPARLGISLSLQNGDDIVTNYTYSYTSNESLSDKLTINLGGTNAAGYYFDGFNIVDGNGNKQSVPESQPECDVIGGQMTIDLQWLQEWLQSTDIQTNSMYYIQPILKEKTATIYFHSGTGEEEEFGDGRNGLVFMSNNRESTDFEFEISTIEQRQIKFRSAINLNAVYFDAEQNGVQMAISDIFHHRKGYLSDSQYLWAWTNKESANPISDNKIFGNSFALASDFFVGTGVNAEIHLYRIWTPNTYTITFLSNGGEFAESATSLQFSVTFDQKFDQVPTEENIDPSLKVSRKGYHFANWTLEDRETIVFGINGDFVAGEYFNDKGEYIATKDLVVYASWTAIVYQVEVNFNSATSFAGKDGKQIFERYELAYDSSFADIVFDLNIRGVEALSTTNVSRPGFAFGGLYAISDVQSTRIFNSTIFNQDLLSFKFPELPEDNNIALILYVGWQIDQSYFDLSLYNNSFEDLIYNKTPQTMYLAKLFGQQNLLRNNYTISVEENTLNISIPEDVNAKLEIKLQNIQNAVVSDGNWQSFVVENAGEYIVRLTFTFSDLAANLNLGQFYSLDIDLKVVVQKAQLSLDDFSAFNEMYYIINLQRMVGPFLSSSDNSSLSTSVSLSGAIQLIKNLNRDDQELANADNMQAYEYAMTKYYLLATTNDAQQHITYKEWTYSDFLNFKASTSEDTLSQIKHNTQFFGFFDYENMTDSQELISYAANISILAEKDQKLEFAPTNLQIANVKISASLGTNLMANNLYELWVYVNSREENALDNYALQMDADGYCFMAGTAYIMPQILTIKNAAPNKTVYYSDRYEESTYRDAQFVGEGQSLQIDEQAYYQIGVYNGVPLYFTAQLRTSNIGVKGEDVTYTYSGLKNYLYFVDVSFVVAEGENYRDISSYFKPIMSDSDLFTILNTAGVATLRMNARYLTKRDNFVYLSEFEDDLYENLLQISEIKIKDQGTISDPELLKTGDTYYNDKDMALFEIVQNDANVVEIFASNFVESVTFSVKNRNLSKYISLFKWSDSALFEPDGTMEISDNFTVEMEDLNIDSTSDIAVVDYYAIYTDLVRLEIDRNFPSSYGSDPVYALKLGEAITEDILPYEEGFGYAASLRLLRENGEEGEDYLSLNSESGVFEGLAEYKYATVKMSARWRIDSQIEHELRFDQTTNLAVYSLSSLNVNEVLSLRNMNSRIFDYVYTWSVKYDYNIDGLPNVDGKTEIYETENLALRQNGSSLASGQYTITISGTLRQEFLEAGTLLDESTKETQCSETFTLNFIKNRLESVQLPQSDTLTAEYDGTDHKQDFAVQIEYTAWDNELNDYGTERTILSNLIYTESGLVYFEIDDGTKHEIIDTGIYNIKLMLLETLFDLGTFSQQDLTFQFEVTPQVVDLNSQDYFVRFSDGKLFNQQDPSMERQILLGNELVTITLRRSKNEETFNGEDLGSYAVYLENVTCKNPKNFKFVYSVADGEPLVLFENGKKTETIQSIGTFTIRKTGELQISLSGDQMTDGVLSVQYDGQTYTLSISENSLSVLHTNSDAKQLTMNLYDVTLGKDIEASGDIWNILHDKLSSLKPMFSSTDIQKAVTDAGTYNFLFDISGSKLENYFSSISISADYKFVITPQVIATESFNLDKTYDHNKTAYLSLSGDVLDDFEGQEIYIVATYDSVHVGTTYVTLQLAVASTQKIANYTLESSRVSAEITPLKATLKLSAENDTFDFGGLSTQTLANNFPISKATLQDEEGGDLDLSLLTSESEYYSIAFKLADPSMANNRGFLYKGEYTIGTKGTNILIEYMFRDFDMTIIAPKITINTLTINHNIQEGLIQLTTIEIPQATYTEDIIVPNALDVVTLTYKIEGVQDFSKPLAAGVYNFELQADYNNLNGSIEVKIDSNNRAVNVVEVSEEIVFAIDENDLSKLTKTYDGTEFVIQAASQDNLQNMTFTISHGAVNETIKIVVVSEVEISAFTKLEVYYSESKQTSFKDVGRYELTFVADTETYHNLILRGYQFVITPREIDTSKLTRPDGTNVFDKVYDGNTATEPYYDFEGRVGEDDVRIVGRYNDANASVDKKVVSIYLDGSARNNYVLDENTTMATISAAKATISLDRQSTGRVEFEYGQISVQDERVNGISFVVKSGERQLSSMVYSLTAKIADAKLSKRNYLEVSESGYILSVDGSVPSGNYQIETLEIKIYIVPKQVQLEFTRAGEVTVEYGTPEWKNLSEESPFTYTITASAAPLLEELSVSLFIENLGQKDIGRYKIASAQSLNDNYEIISVTDNVKAFEIVRQRQRIFMLLDDGQTKIETTYDGSIYDQITIEQKDINEWKLVISSTLQSSQRIEKTLKAYVLVDGEYQEFEGFVLDLKSTLRFSQVLGDVRNVGTYQIVATNTTSSTNDDVKMGQSNTAIAFTLEITQQDVYFKSPIVVKTFNNADAVYTDYASEFVTNLASTDKLSIEMSFKDGDKIAKYSGTEYQVEATLVGEGAQNYKLNITYAGQPVTGTIAKAGINFEYSAQSFKYGEIKEGKNLLIYYSFDYKIEDFDFEKYLKEKMEAYPELGQDDIFSVIVSIKTPHYSSAGYLAAGQYELEIVFNSSVNCDFLISSDGYVIDGVNHTSDDYSSYTRLIVDKKELTLLPASGKTWQDIFTKSYDESLDAAIVDEHGTPLFNIREGDILTGETGKTDEVYVAKASYSAVKGNGLLMNFELDGAEKDNYQITQQIYGTINPVQIKLVFDYDQSATTNVVGEMISAIAYPFIENSSYLTSNSYDENTSSTQNFPSMLSGIAGHVFTHWSLRLTNLSEEQITNLQRFGLQIERIEEENACEIIVGNNSATVALLAELLKDNTYGMAYNSIQEITFHDNWEIEKYSLSIQIADEDGTPRKLGKVSSVDAFEETIDDYLFIEDQFEYGRTFTLRALPNERVTLYGFYLGTQHITNDGTYTGGKFVVGQDGGFYTLQVQGISADLNIVVRFSVQKVNIVLQLSQHQDAELSGGSLQFVKDQDGNYNYMTDYFSLEDVYFSALPAITLVGHNHNGFLAGGKTISPDQYQTTLLQDCLSEDMSSTITLTITPILEAKTITLILNYGYLGGERITTSVKFGSPYRSAAEWQDVLEDREGYHFEGWFDENNQEVVGDDLVLTEETITLTAVWSEKTYELRLTITHGEIDSLSGADFQREGNTYIANVYYNFTITFTLSADQGYKISDQWQSPFEVQLKNDGKSASVSLTMPARSIDFEVPMIALPHIVTYSGEHLQNVDVFDTTTDQATPIEDITQTEGGYSFEQTAGQSVRFEVSAERGYIMTDSVEFRNAAGEIIGGYELENLDYSIMLSGNVLILEIKGLTNDISIIFKATEQTNNITLEFDLPEAIESVTIGSQSYALQELPTLQRKTGETLNFYVQFAHGYTYKESTSDEFDVSCEEVPENTGRYLFEISQIFSDGSVQILSALRRFTLQTSAISYDDAQQQTNEPNNQAYIIDGEQSLTSVEKDFGSVVTIRLQNAPSFKFSGWSKDGVNIISESQYENEGLTHVGGNTWNYKITDNTSLYVIFAESDYTISLATLDYVYYISGDNSVVPQPFVEIEGGEYFESDMATPITTNFQLVYGSSKQIVFNLPTGYVFYGFGFFDADENFVFLGGQYLRPANTRQVEVTINTLDFGSTFVDRIYMVVVSLNTTIHVSSKINFAGVYDDDLDVGSMELVNANGQAVNSAGWVDGTRIHYASQDFSNGQLKNVRNFSVVAFTGDLVYLKVNNPRDGYRLSAVLVGDEQLQSPILSTDGYAIYRISNIVGGEGDIEIIVLYTPNLNTINLKFVQEGQVGDSAVHGGMFIANAQTDITKMWTAGNESSEIVITAFTDVSFMVSAYIRAGYYVNRLDVENNLVILDPSGIVKHAYYSPLSVELTGFTGVITFVVEGFAGTSDISIVLKASTYTLQFMDKDEIVATVHDVGFNTNLQDALTGQNINLIKTLERHHFEGYFTYQNGAGVRYIDSTGKATSSWQENGYAFNSLTNKYELTPNAFVDEDGTIVIRLYLYMSFLKTRITFNFQPSGIDLTAQDMVTGIDPTNSWFYEASPNYIEISFNTDIYITAPEAAGYKFFKFIISQKTFDGTELTAVTSYQNRVPWSTNDVDQIVEVNVEVVYFAQVVVNCVGGEGTFEISQDNGGDAQADLLVQRDHYVATGVDFTITAIASDGYKFNQWRYLGQISSRSTITLKTSSQVYLTMNLSGLPVTLDFTDYDTSFGHIEYINILDKQGRQSTETLGTGSVGNFKKNDRKLKISVNVGDIITFAVATNENMSVSWNADLDGVEFKEFAGRLQLYDFEITSKFANAEIKVNPTFTSSSRSIYISRKFDKTLDRAADLNEVDFAGQIFFDGKETNYVFAQREKTIELDTMTNVRYAICQITIHSLNGQNCDITELLSEGKLTLSEQDFENRELSNFGTLYMEITYTRLMWEDLQTESEGFEGDGSNDNPYKIENADQLLLFMKLVNSGAKNENGELYRNLSFALTSNINLNERFWTPIGTYENPFNGSFDFNNQSVVDVSNAIIYERISYNGLFGILGPNAKISYGSRSNWWIYLIVGIVLALAITLTTLILVNRARKKKNEELAKH